MRGVWGFLISAHAADWPACGGQWGSGDGSGDLASVIIEGSGWGSGENPADNVAVQIHNDGINGTVVIQENVTNIFYDAVF